VRRGDNIYTAAARSAHGGKPRPQSSSKTTGSTQRRALTKFGINAACTGRRRAVATHRVDWQPRQCAKSVGGHRIWI